MSSTLVDSAFAGSQDLAWFFSAPVSLPASGKAATSTTSQNPSTTHLVHFPVGTCAAFRANSMQSPDSGCPPELPVPAHAIAVLLSDWTSCAVRWQLADGKGVGLRTRTHGAGTVAPVVSQVLPVKALPWLRLLKMVLWVMVSSTVPPLDMTPLV